MDSILASHTGSGPWFLHFLVAIFIQYYFDANMFRIKIQTRVNAFNSNVSQIDLWTVRRCFRHFMKMYSNSGKLWSKGSSNFNIAKNLFIYAFTAIKITTAILNTYAENVSSISRCVVVERPSAILFVQIYIQLFLSMSNCTDAKRVPIIGTGSL